MVDRAARIKVTRNPISPPATPPTRVELSKMGKALRFNGPPVHLKTTTMPAIAQPPMIEGAIIPQTFIAHYTVAIHNNPKLPGLPRALATASLPNPAIAADGR